MNNIESYLLTVVADLAEENGFQDFNLLRNFLRTPDFVQDSSVETLEVRAPLYPVSFMVVYNPTWVESVPEEWVGRVLVGQLISLVTNWSYVSVVK